MRCLTAGALAAAAAEMYHNRSCATAVSQLVQVVALQLDGWHAVEHKAKRQHESAWTVHTRVDAAGVSGNSNVLSGALDKGDARHGAAINTHCGLATEEDNLHRSHRRLCNVVRAPSE